MPIRSKLTSEVVEQILEKVLQGNKPTVAAVACGISASRWSEYMGRADAQEEPYLTFREQVEHAVALSQTELVSELRNNRSWMAKLAILERRFPEEWGQKSAPPQAPTEKQQIEIVLTEAKDVCKSD